MLCVCGRMLTQHQGCLSKDSSSNASRMGIDKRLGGNTVRQLTKGIFNPLENFLGVIFLFLHAEFTQFFPIILSYLDLQAFNLIFSPIPLKKESERKSC